MTRPKLLVVTPSPPTTVGGTQTLVRALAGSLAEDFGVQVTVATADAPEAAGTSSARPWRETRMPGVTRPRPPGAPSRRRLAGDVWFPDLSRIMDADLPDAVLYTPHNSPCAHETARLARERSLPLILMPLVHLDLWRHVNSSARRLYRSAELVIAVSEPERRWLVERVGIAPARVLRLRYGSDGGVATPRPFSAGAVDPDRPFRLITVGGYRAHKRVEDQIGALALLRLRSGRPYRLTVVGAAASPVRGRLQAEARRRGVSEYVTLLEDCRDEEIAQSLRSAGVFLFTSASESLGLALFEAIAAGTFPVVYPHPVYRDLVESSGFGAVARTATPRALADAVLGAPRVIPAPVEQRRREWLSERSRRRMAEPLAERLAGSAAKTAAALPA